MSRGRSRHQSSRRRAYASRQRETRERHLRAAREDQTWQLTDESALSHSEGDADGAAWFGLRIAARASA